MSVKELLDYMRRQDGEDLRRNPHYHRQEELHPLPPSPHSQRSSRSAAPPLSVPHPVPPHQPPASILDPQASIASLSPLPSREWLRDKEWLFQNLADIHKSHPGRWIAVVGRAVVASTSRAMDAWDEARRLHPGAEPVVWLVREQA